MDLNYQQDLFIDKSRLDEECLDQPIRFARWGRLHAEAIAEQDRAKQALSITRADIEKQVRIAFAADLTKARPTEAMIKTEVDLNIQVVEAEEVLIKMSRQANTLRVAKEAFADRKKELENLVQLWLSMYWSDPKVPQRTERRMMDLDEERHQDVLSQNLRLKGGINV